MLITMLWVSFPKVDGDLADDSYWANVQSSLCNLCCILVDVTIFFHNNHNVSVVHAWHLLLLTTSLPAETSGNRPGRSAAWLGPTAATAMHCKSFNSFGGQSHGTINICQCIIASLAIGNFIYVQISNFALVMGAG